MKGKHAQKNFGAIGTMALTPLSLKTPGGGGVAYKDRAWLPPPPQVAHSHTQPVSVPCLSPHPNLSRTHHYGKF